MRYHGTATNSPCDIAFQSCSECDGALRLISISGDSRRSWRYFRSWRVMTTRWIWSVPSQIRMIVDQRAVSAVRWHVGRRGVSTDSAPFPESAEGPLPAGVCSTGSPSSAGPGGPAPPGTRAQTCLRPRMPLPAITAIPATASKRAHNRLRHAPPPTSHIVKYAGLPGTGQPLWSRARPSRMKSSANSNSASSSHWPRAPPWVTARAISTT